MSSVNHVPDEGGSPLPEQLLSQIEELAEELQIPRYLVLSRAISVMKAYAAAKSENDGMASVLIQGGNRVFKLPIDPTATTIEEVELSTVDPPLLDKWCEQWYEKGLEHFEIKEYARSIKSFDTALEIADAHRTATSEDIGIEFWLWYRRGLALMPPNRWDEAIESFDKAAQYSHQPCKNHQHIPDLLLVHKAGCFAAQNDYEQALKYLDLCLEKKNNFLFALYSKTHVLIEMGDKEQALSVIDYAIASNEETPETVETLSNFWHIKGFLLTYFGRYEEACESYDKSQQLDPDDISAIECKAEPLVELGRYAEALEIYEQLPPDDPEYYLKKAHLYRRLNRETEALKCYSKEMQRSNNPLVYLLKAELLLEMNRNKDTVRVCKRLLTLHPTYLCLENILGMVYRGTQRLDASIEQFTKALFKHPDVGMLWLERGATYIDLKNYELAIADLRKAIELDEEIVSAWRYLAIAFEKTNCLDEALAACDRLIEMEDVNARNLGLRALILDRLGLAQEALRNYDEALKRSPTNPEIRYNRDFCLSNHPELLTTQS